MFKSIQIPQIKSTIANPRTLAPRITSIEPMMPMTLKERIRLYQNLLKNPYKFIRSNETFDYGRTIKNLAKDIIRFSITRMSFMLSTGNGKMYTIIIFKDSVEFKKDPIDKIPEKFYLKLYE